MKLIFDNLEFFNYDKIWFKFGLRSRVYGT